MKLIVGLGNPGKKYLKSRHNVGHIVVDKIKNQKSKIKNVMFIKTNTFMNNSGSFVKDLISKDSSILLSNVYIVQDDLDLPLGSWKMQFAKGPKEHGGINDIEQKLGTDKFWRIRIGVDKRKPESGISGEAYVLENFSAEEKRIIDQVIAEICKKLATL